MADFEFGELDRLAADLGEVPKHVGPRINSAIQRTSMLVKKDAAKGLTGQWSGARSAIDYEIKTFQGFGASVIQAEIGYNKSLRGGPLGNLREFGAPKNSLAPHNDLKNALEANRDDFEKGLTIALDQAQKKAGL